MSQCEKISNDANDRVTKLNTSFIVGIMNDVDDKLN